jgi:transposase
MIPDDAPVRILSNLLDQVDWSEWEAKYESNQGRPPIHPKRVAGAILYGLQRRVRTTRELEEATNVRIDFMWLLEGTTIDYSTFARFRQRFDGDQIEGLFQQVAILALQGKTVSQLAIDGTKIRANAARDSAKSEATLADQVDAISEELLELYLQQLEADRQEETLNDEQASADAGANAARIAQLEAQKVKHETAHAKAVERNEQKARKGDARRGSTRVSITDSDAHVMPNKEGGYAPNFTPTAAVDCGSGVIVAADVVPGNREADAVLPALEAVETLTGQKADDLLIDSGLVTGKILGAVAEKDVVLYSSAGTREKGNPAQREDPSQAVPEADRDALDARQEEACADS